MMKKEFMIVGDLTMEFEGKKKLHVVGRDVIPTRVDVEFDEKGTTDSKVTIKQYELECGLVSMTELVMPPLVSYEFKDIFVARGEKMTPPVEESWKIGIK
jgi:hypothetical protein